MGINNEIERKFLVNGSFKSFCSGKSILKQGYLSTDPERTVRVRIKDNAGFLTIKGASSNSGTTRVEWEKTIEYSEAMALLKLCKPNIIEKTRYFIKHEGFVIEVDEFNGDNEGLVIAEIELNHENEKVNLPEFIGKELTGDHRYYNSYLSQNPYKNW